MQNTKKTRIGRRPGRITSPQRVTQPLVVAAPERRTASVTQCHGNKRREPKSRPAAGWMTKTLEKAQRKDGREREQPKRRKEGKVMGRSYNRDGKAKNGREKVVRWREYKRRGVKNVKERKRG